LAGKYIIYQTADIKKKCKKKIIAISAVKLQTKSTISLLAAFTETLLVI
jgi:hypothetical protein